MGEGKVGGRRGGARGKGGEERKHLSYFTPNPSCGPSDGVLKSQARRVLRQKRENVLQ